MDPRCKSQPSFEGLRAPSVHEDIAADVADWMTAASPEEHRFTVTVAAEETECGGDSWPEDPAAGRKSSPLDSELTDLGTTLSGRKRKHEAPADEHTTTKFHDRSRNEFTPTQASALASQVEEEANTAVFGIIFLPGSGDYPCSFCTFPYYSSSSTDFNFSSLERREELGSGKFGVVKKAFDAKSGKVYALKIVPRVGALTQLKKREIAREVSALVKARNMNVVQCFGVLQQEAHVEIGLEFMECSLEERIEQAPGQKLSEKQAAVYTKCLLKGLEHLHSPSVAIVHQDLKPANCLVSKQGILKIADFGSVSVPVEMSKEWTDQLKQVLKLRDEEAVASGQAQPLSQGRVRAPCGTPEFMAPEVCKGKDHSRLSDIWAMGITVLKMLGVAHVYEQSGQRLNDMAIILKLGSGEIRPPVPESWEPLLREFMEYCLAAEPTQRLSAAALLALRFLFATDASQFRPV